ncbi:MAG: competence protein ComGC [Methylophagaceae bacterium]|jgi:competence protein ComGC
MRILILIAIALLLYLIIGSFLRKQKRLQSDSNSTAEKMVSCHHCGLHILEKEAIQSANKSYCTTNHLEADKQAK